MGRIVGEWRRRPLPRRYKIKLKPGANPSQRILLLLLISLKTTEAGKRIKIKSKTMIRKMIKNRIKVFPLDFYARCGEVFFVQ
jgi:hypothetical protein